MLYRVVLVPIVSHNIASKPGDDTQDNECNNSVARKKHVIEFVASLQLTNNICTLFRVFRCYVVALASTNYVCYGIRFMITTLKLGRINHANRLWA